MIEGWNWNLSEAPANTRVIVEARGYDYWAPSIRHGAGVEARGSMTTGG